MQGRLDSALTDTGKRQADENGRLLRRHAVERLLVSPLGRTTETAYIINSHVQAEIEFVDELVERDSGRWSGLTLDDIRADDPANWRAREGNEWHHRPPDGENMPDVIERVAPVLERLTVASAQGGATPAESTSSSPVTAIISHGMVGKAILAHFLHLNDQSGWDVRQPNDVVYELTLNARAAEGVDCDHYRRGEGPLPGLIRSREANPAGQSGQ